MTTGDRVTFDTNILFYALDSDGGEKHTIAAGLLRSARGGQCVLLLQSLAELYNALHKRPGISSSKAQEFIEKNMEVFPVVQLDGSDLLPAIAFIKFTRCNFGTPSSLRLRAVSVAHYFFPRTVITARASADCRC